MLRSTRGYMGDIKGDVPLPWGKWGILTDPLRRKLWDGAQSQLCLLNTWAKLRISCSLKKKPYLWVYIPFWAPNPHMISTWLIVTHMYVYIYANIYIYIYIRISIYMSYIGYIYIHIPLHPQFISPESSVNSQPLEGLEVPEGAWLLHLRVKPRQKLGGPGDGGLRKVLRCGNIAWPSFL